MVVAALLFAASPQPSKTAAASSVRTVAICEVGRAALHDLPTAGDRNEGDTYYAGTSKAHHDLLEACPALRKELPAGYPLADPDAWARASVHVPIPGRTTKPAYIYSIEVPEIGADLRTAVVRVSYDCTGLCGGSLEYRYVRIETGWCRDGAGRMLWVS